MGDPQDQTPDFIPAQQDQDFIPAEQPKKAIAPPPAAPKQGMLDKADEAITSTLAPNPQNYSSALKTNAIEVPKTLGREVYSGAKSILSAPGAIYHAITDTSEPGEPSSVPERAIYRMAIKPAVNAAQDYSSGKVGYQDVLENAPEAIGQGAGTVVGSKLAETLAPKAIGAADAVGRKPIPIAPEDAARGVTKAVNPSVNEWPNYIKATAQEAGNIKAFAAKNNLPLNTQLDWAKAARGAATESQNFFNEKVLGPHASDEVATAGTGFKGKNAGEGQTATLGEIDRRVATINKQLNSAYNKRESGQTMEALANEPELIAERDGLNEILRDELAKRTGMTPEQVAGVRQRYGRMYSIGDKTEAAVNQRQSSAGKAAEGRRDVPTTVSGAGVDLFNRLIRGGPEGIANRAFVRSLGKTNAIPPTELPEVNQPMVPKPVRRPIWQEQ